MDAPSNDPRFVDDDLQVLRADYVQSLWQGMYYVALLAVPITLWRVYGTGWLPLYGIHLALALACAAGARLQRRWPYRWRAGTMVALLWLVGLPGVFTFGLAASSVWWLVLSGIVASKLYSVRVGVLVSTLTAGALLLAAAGFVSGRLQPAIAADAYLRLPSSWAALVIVTGVFAVLVLRSSGAYADGSARLLRQIRDQRDEIERLSMHDALTGLPMARLAEDRLEVALHAARRTGRKVALLYIDLDGFKAINDGFGHEAGDRVLVACAHAMRGSMRAEDTVARIGGDEFLAIAGGMEETGSAAVVAAKLIASIGKPLELDGLQLGVGASVGIAIYPDDALDARALRRLADQAMYASKRRGRGRFAFVNEQVDVALESPAGVRPGGGADQPPASSRDAIAS